MEKEKNKVNNVKDEYDNIDETISVLDFDITDESDDDLKVIIGDKFNGKCK